MKTKHIKKLYIFFISLIAGTASCGNPLIRSQYDEASRFGDSDLYQIAGSGDLEKLEKHPEGRFIVTGSVEVSNAVSRTFSGTLQGAGEGSELRLKSGMLFNETQNAVIRDITFTVFAGVVPGSAVGAAAGTASNTQFINVHVKGDADVWPDTSVYKNAQGGAHTGGIVGVMDAGSSIIRCSSIIPAINASGGSVSAGGLAGQNNGGIIQFSYVHSKVSPDGLAVYGGGIAGSNSGTIEDSYFAHSTPVGGQIFGGIAGQSSGTIKNCYAHASSAVGDDTGGTTTAIIRDLETAASYTNFDKKTWYFSDLAATGPFARLIYNPDTWQPEKNSGITW